MSDVKVPSYFKTKEFEGFFADIYDLTTGVITFGWLKKVRRKAIEALELKEGQSVIDFACGTGAFTKIAAEVVGEKGQVVGVDLAKRMLKVAVRKSKEYPQTTYLRMNFEKVPYKDEFDVAMVGLGAHEVPKNARYNLYKQAYRVLKPKGRFMVFDYVIPKNIILRIIFKLFLRVTEYPSGWEYVKENHKKILEGIGFKRTKHKVKGFLEVAVYQR